MKHLLTSKNFWCAVLLFVFSLLEFVGTIPTIRENPKISGIVGMLFAVTWVVLRLITNTTVSASFAIPNIFGKRK